MNGRKRVGKRILQLRERAFLVQRMSFILSGAFIRKSKEMKLFFYRLQGGAGSIAKSCLGSQSQMVGRQDSRCGGKAAVIHRIDQV